MNISMIGSLRTHIKTLEMQQKWTQRQQEGDYTGKRKSLDEWLSSSNTQSAAMRELQSDDMDLQSIQLKVNKGKKLTPKEKEYLQKHDPKTLEKAEEIERTRENIKQALRRCRTKEDVERVRMTQLSVSMSTLNAVENNPNIPLSKKLEIAMEEQGKVNAMENELHNYVEEGRYQKLPTQAEQLEAQKQENEQKHPEQTQTVEKTEASEQSEQIEHEPVAEQPAQEYKPHIEIETPEQQKVKRAKAQAAYTKATNMAETTMLTTKSDSAKLDIQG